MSDMQQTEMYKGNQRSRTVPHLVAIALLLMTISNVFLFLDENIVRPRGISAEFLLTLGISELFQFVGIVLLFATAVLAIASRSTIKPVSPGEYVFASLLLLLSFIPFLLNILAPYALIFLNSASSIGFASGNPVKILELFGIIENILSIFLIGLGALLLGLEFVNRNGKWVLTAGFAIFVIYALLVSYSDLSAYLAIASGQPVSNVINFLSNLPVDNILLIRSLGLFLMAVSLFMLKQNYSPAQSNMAGIEQLPEAAGREE